MDSIGNLEWEKNYGGTSDERIYSLIQTNTEHFVFAASASSHDGDVTGNHGSSDIWIAEIDNSGELLWQKCLGDSWIDHPNHILRTKDDGFIICGETWWNEDNAYGGRDAWIIKTDSLANTEWEKCIGTVDFDDAYGAAIHNDKIFVLGNTEGTEGLFANNHGNYDFWIAQFTDPTVSTEKHTIPSLKIYPNPSALRHITFQKCNSTDHFRISIFNSSGKLLHQQDLISTETIIDLSSRNSGIYLVAFIMDGRIIDTKKIILR